VPRLNEEMQGLDRVAETFAFEWKAHHEGRLEQETVFGLTPAEDWAYFVEASGFDDERMSGARVLDAGCGSGSLTRQMGEHGAAIAIGMDINEAVDEAFAYCRDLPNVHIVQGNILSLPFKRGVFDVVWSNGVIHHTPDAPGAARVLSTAVKPGGKLYIWVYAKRFSPFMLTKDVLDALRVTRLPERALLALCTMLAYPSLALIALYRAITRLPFFPRTPWIEWTSRRRTIRELRLTWFDSLSPAYDTSHSEDEVIDWFRDVGFEHIRTIEEPKVGVSGVAPKPA
jgi:SAM-dependent methyltransferase